MKPIDTLSLTDKQIVVIAGLLDELTRIATQSSIFALRLSREQVAIIDAFKQDAERITKTK